MPKLLDVAIPQIKVRVTQEIIDRSTPDHRGRCLGAMAIRELLKDKGVCSIAVTPDTVRFNLMVLVDGKPALVRLGYWAPATLQRAAHTFDYNADKHGTEYARVQQKPFTFILQGHSGWALPVTKRGPNKKPKSKSRPRIMSTHEVVRRCSRRYHPETAFVAHEVLQAA